MTRPDAWDAWLVIGALLGILQALLVGALVYMVLTSLEGR